MLGPLGYKYFVPTGLKPFSSSCFVITDNSNTLTEHYRIYGSGVIVCCYYSAPVTATLNYPTTEFTVGKGKITGETKALLVEPDKERNSNEMLQPRKEFRAAIQSYIGIGSNLQARAIVANCHGNEYPFFRFSIALTIFCTA